MLFYFSILVLVVGCSGESGESQKSAHSDSGVDSVQTGRKARQPANLYTLTIDGVQLGVEIAQDPEALEKGLMFRDRLPENQGMLFVFPAPRVLSFWMRNTYIPLDIAFIDELGIIIDIQHMLPNDESKHYVSGSAALYALEMNGGWFKKNNITTGSKVLF
jgi:uncharacterized membrane protein (UPF0127 family)